jgi:Ca2+/H+ antiporter
MQISLFVIPFLVLIGWGIGQPLSLNFQVRAEWRAFAVLRHLSQGHAHAYDF